jgi:hypothetical protein
MPTVELLARLVRGDADAAHRLQTLAADRIRDDARAHGVLPLVLEQLAASHLEPLRRSLGADATGEVMADMARERELCRIVEAFDRAGVRVLLIKGAALAYSLYSRPDLRPRIDTDLLIDGVDRQRAHDVLVEERYEPDIHVAGELVSKQATYVRQQDGRVVHVVDLHWAIVNPHAFADTLTFTELASASVPIPTLGSAARGLSDVHALLLACVHRSAHHAGSDRLIHLLASRLDASHWETFDALARDRAVVTVCRHSLDETTRRFATRVPERVLADVAMPSAPARHEPTAAFVSQRGSLHVLRSDLRALSGWRARLRLLREHLFPSADYMTRVYAPASVAPLPWLYARRVWRGARKWLARV